MKKILFLAFFSTVSCYASDGSVQSYNPQTGQYTVGAMRNNTNLNSKKIDTGSNLKKPDTKFFQFKR